MDKSNHTKIYVIHYKDGEPFPDLPGYIHLLAGMDNNSQGSVLTGDNTGDHISYKNKYYSELTGIYWIYKNQSSDIVGTSHYRRFFTAKGVPILYKMKEALYYLAGMNRSRHGLIYTSDKNFWLPRILTTEEASGFLEEYDAILPVKRKLRQSIEKHYAKYHDSADIQIIRNIILEKTPGYCSSFETTFQQKGLYANNMMIMKREKFELLCDWLFSILFEFEGRIDLNTYQDYQQRVLGFISERLITVWINHNQLKVVELPLIYFKFLKKNK